MGEWAIFLVGWILGVVSLGFFLFILAIYLFIRRGAGADILGEADDKESDGADNEFDKRA